MEESCEDQPKPSESASIDSMDLLSLTFKSFGLRDSTTQREDFRNLEEENIEKEDASKQTRRGSKRSRDESRTSPKQDSKELKTITLDEVAWHDTFDNCWIVVHDFVYDCTDFLKNHPGGSDVILEYAGRDATFAFIGTGHSKAARQSLERFLIGELPPEERIFRVPSGLKVPGF
ncbi:uncharacterized protein LOC143147661 isoform X2 [Ptiloglossa arizonensis]|uniref:uncharacterized protein LOC143147661 isoform X2 n=1 Tax=Ptiloglossa arizonensis TaxID=3350558 RepID=UPI003F9F3E8A